MNVQEYLKRVRHDGEVRATIETLRSLQRTHMLTVPFENLDIARGRKIRIDELSLWEKLIDRNRGGFCYELNGLFAWLLKQIGFEVTYLNARDYFPETDTFGMDFDHLALMVRIPGQSTRWLVDVGYGDNFTLPLDIDDPEEQADGLRGYWVEPFRDGYQLWQRTYDGNRRSQYYFDLAAHSFPSEYEAGCLYHQTAPESFFLQRKIISRLTDDGRVTLDDNKLIVTTNGVRSEQLIGEEEHPILLQKYFGVNLVE